MTEFEEWSDRIISGVSFENKDEPGMLRSIKHFLANALMHIGPTEDHKSDAYFIKAVHVNAVKLIATAKIMGYQEEVKKEKQAAAEAKEAELVKQAVEAGK